MKNLKIPALVLALLLLMLTACTGTGTGSGTTSSVPPVESPGATSTPSTPDGTTSPAPTNVRLGLGTVSSTGKSLAATAQKAGSFTYDTTVCAVALDENDSIVSVKFDSVTTERGFDLTGNFTTDIAEPIRSKKEMGADYKMKDASPIGKEWFEQINSLEAWMTGRRSTDVLGMKVTDKNAPDIEELKTSVTINVSDHLKALERAVADAKKAA